MLNVTSWINQNFTEYSELKETHKDHQVQLGSNSWTAKRLQKIGFRSVYEEKSPNPSFS